MPDATKRYDLPARLARLERLTAFYCCTVFATAAGCLGLAYAVGVLSAPAGLTRAPASLGCALAFVYFGSTAVRAARPGRRASDRLMIFCAVGAALGAAALAYAEPHTLTLFFAVSTGIGAAGDLFQAAIGRRALDF